MARPAKTRARLRHAAGAAVLTLGLACAVPATASAPLATGFGLAPASGRPFLRLQAAPGHVVRGAVKVRNLSGHVRTIRLQASELVNALGGGASFRHPRAGSAARWLHLEADTVRLAPHAARVVRFTADVPTHVDAPTTRA